MFDAKVLQKLLRCWRLPGAWWMSMALEHEIMRKYEKHVLQKATLVRFFFSGPSHKSEGVSLKSRKRVISLSSML